MRKSARTAAAATATGPGYARTCAAFDRTRSACGSVLVSAGRQQNDCATYRGAEENRLLHITGSPFDQDADARQIPLTDGNTIVFASVGA